MSAGILIWKTMSENGLFSNCVEITRIKAKMLKKFFDALSSKSTEMQFDLPDGISVSVHSLHYVFIVCSYSSAYALNNETCG